MRTIKAPEVRRAEILDAAEALFVTKGYSGTTVMDILGATGIAKGTFYYYFKSKEDVMDAVIARIVESEGAAAEKIAGDPVLTPPEKLRRIFLAQQPRRGGRKDRMLQQFHLPQNAEMHQKSIVAGVHMLAPVLTQIAEEGIRQGVFHTPYPRESVELLLISGQFLLDGGIFGWSGDEREQKVRGFVHMMERTLGAAEGTFAPMLKILSER